MRHRWKRNALTPQSMAETKCVSRKTVKGVATITFDPERSFQGGGLEELARAVEECAGYGERLHAVVFYPEAVEASEVVVVGPESSARSLDKLFDSVRQLPQQVLGFALGKTDTAGTCLLLACDVVLAAAGAELCLTEKAAGRPRAVPTEVLRRLGGNMSMQLLSAGGELSANRAMQLGLVSEVCATAEALQLRRDEIIVNFQSNPALAAVSMKWLQRRAVHTVPVLATASADTAMSSTSGGVKRRLQSSPSAPYPPSKRRRLRIRDTTTWLRDTVLNALLEEEGTSAPTCGLVSDVVAGALLAEPESRTQFHEDVIKMIGKALDGLKTKAEEFVNEVQAMADGAEAEMSARKAAEASAESDIVSLRTTIRERRLALDTVNEALVGAMQEEKKAQEEQERGDSKYHEMNTEKEKLEAADRDLYKPAKFGQLTKAKAKKNAEALVKLGTEYGFEKSFLVGLPGAFSKNEPGKRSSFDEMVMTAFETQVSTRISELDQKLVQEMPGIEAREAMVQSAKLQHRAAKEKQEKARADIEAARKKERAGVVALQGAKHLVQAFNEELKKMAVDYACAKSRLDAFKDGPMAAFEQLRRHGAAATVPVEIAEDEVAEDDKDKSEAKGDENTPTEGSAAAGSSAEAEGAAKEAEANEEHVDDKKDAGTAEREPEVVSCDFGTTDARKVPEAVSCDFGTTEASADEEEADVEMKGQEDAVEAEKAGEKREEADVQMAGQDTMEETSGSKSAAMDSMEAETEQQATQESTSGAGEADKPEEMQEQEKTDGAVARDSFCTAVDPTELEAAEGVKEGEDAAGVAAGTGENADVAVENAEEAAPADPYSDAEVKAKPNTDAPEADEDQAPEEEMAAADAYGGETGGVSTQEATQSGDSAGVEGDGYGDQEEEADAEKGDEEVEEENVDEME
mmetsp:Transcript_14249/g.25118  ORF Transcript_14249/g.25118 Transcript_14249/m.25118 type:complete len:917 (+) Transcript_14249:41-2791(+)